MDQRLLDYIQQQLSTIDERLKRFTYSFDGKTELPKRNKFSKLQEYIDNFTTKKSPSRMVIMPGFRGVGKTTLMAQLCASYKNLSEKKLNYLFVSVEDARNLFEADITDLLSAYEVILGESLATIKEPVYIFLDEIQSDPKWPVTLKTLFEKTTNVFFCCTGSSAVVLQKLITGDLARRVIIEKLTPLSFTEYQMAKNNISPSNNLKKEIGNALYFSDSATDVFKNLESIKHLVHQYWASTNKQDIQKYLAHGSLPFSFSMPNETLIYESISVLLDKVIEADLPMLGSFDQNTLQVVKRLLFVVAENDITSFKKLEQKFNISWNTISRVFEALEKAEILLKIPAYGTNMTVAKKPSKYLFLSPAIRMSFFYSTGIEHTYLTRQGKLLEDAVGNHLYQEFKTTGRGDIRYDSQEGGADFILQILNKKQLVIEVGLGNKNLKQIVTSSKKINSDYNIIFSNHELELDKATNTIFVPLDYYFLQ